jgi:hypothetical protein
MDKVTECQYLGNGNVPCGCTALHNESSYCKEHYGMIYQEGTARARRKKDERIAAAVWDLQAEFIRAAEELISEGYDFAEPLWEVKETEEEEV